MVQKINHSPILPSGFVATDVTSLQRNQADTIRALNDALRIHAVGINEQIDTTTAILGVLAALDANVLTWAGSPSSANLLAAMTDSTGTGLLVFNDAPLFTEFNVGFDTEIITVAVQVAGGDDASTAVGIGRASADDASGALAFVKSRNSTPGSFTIVQEDDSIGKIVWYGDDGVDYLNEIARIETIVVGTPAENAVDGAIFFSASVGGTITPSLVLVGGGGVWLGPMVLASYAVASLPDATAFEGQMIYVSDETGGAVPAFSDGTDWRRVTDRVVVS